MDSTDAFFTQTIVGAPYTVMLGRRMNLHDSELQGLEVGLSNGESRLTRLWQDWAVLSHDSDAPGVPRKRPGRIRRLLERHALWVAVFGMGALMTTAGFWGFALWN